MTLVNTVFSDAARLAASRRRMVPCHCAYPRCGVLFMGYRTSRYCSDRCRARDFYHRHKGDAYAEAGVRGAPPGKRAERGELLPGVLGAAAALAEEAEEE